MHGRILEHSSSSVIALSMSPPACHTRIAGVRVTLGAGGGGMRGTGYLVGWEETLQKYCPLRGKLL